MNKIFFTLICGCLIYAATTTARAQSKDDVEQSNVIDSMLYDPNPEIRKLTLAESNDQSTISYAAVNDIDTKVRKLAIQRSDDQSTISYAAVNDKDPEVRKLALQRLL